MKNTIFKVILFIVLIAILVQGNLMVFRSEFPMMWIVTALISVLGLLFFPYKTFFKNKSKSKQ